MVRDQAPQLFVITFHVDTKFSLRIVGNTDCLPFLGARQDMIQSLATDRELTSVGLAPV